MVLYYITDRAQFSGSETERSRALLDRIEQAASAEVDYIQLREKDLPARALQQLAQEALQRVRNHSARTRLLINSRIDIALAIGSDGVHLTSTDLSASEARAIWAASLRSGNSELAFRKWIVGVSCHSVADVSLAASHGADFAVLAPIFEKPGTDLQPIGLKTLAEAARMGELPDRRVEAGDQRATVAVLALGGITLENAADCIRAGAAGIAGIRIFQHADIKETIDTLRRVAGS